MNVPRNQLDFGSIKKKKNTTLKLGLHLTVVDNKCYHVQNKMKWQSQ